MKWTGGHGKSFHQKTVEHQREVAVRGARLQQLREQEEAARQQARDKAGNTDRPGGGAYSGDPIDPPYFDPTNAPLKRQRREKEAPSWLDAGVSDRGVAGQARDVRMETRPDPFWQNHNVSILTFRVEAFDSTGDQQQLVSVEMRGDQLEGVVRDGDWVRVTGRVKRGTMMGTSIEVDSSTGPVTRQSGTTLSPIKIIAGMALVAILLFILWGWAHMANMIP